LRPSHNPRSARLARPHVPQARPALCRRLSCGALGRGHFFR
jgi:hypothetical protein